VRLPPRAWASIVAAGAVAAGIGLRVWVFTSPLSSLESDEAVVGLMAMRALDGDVPVFYWGGLYGGSQEALVTAAAFAVTGPETLVLKLVSVAMFALAAVLVWRVGRRTVGEPAARIGAGLFCIWPPFLAWWSTKARAFYGSGLAIGLAALLLVLRLRERDSKGDAALLGLVLGLGLWATLQSYLLAAPALAWLAWRRPAAYRLAPFALPGLVVGALPWLAWNVTHGWNAVIPRSVAGQQTTYLERLWDFFSIVLPSWLGLRVPYSLDWVPGRLLGALLLVLALAAFVVLLVRWPPGLEPLLVVGVVFPFLSAASSFTYWVGEPRYVVFLAPVPALLLAWALVRAGPAAATIGLTLAFVASLTGLIQLERQGDFLPGRPDQHGPPDIGPVVETLERNGVDRVRANYWIAYRITFESEERVIASPGFWRYKPYRDLVAADPRPGRVFVAGSPEEWDERQDLLRSGYVRRVVGEGFAVYIPPRAGT
jgi:hypothetical protein